MTRLDPPARENVEALVARVRHMPDEARLFTVSQTAAEAEFRIDPELQERLRQAGLPCQQHGDGWRFDGTDLLNAALHLDVGSRQRQVLAWWGRELERPYGAVHSYRMDYRVGCPSPGHRSPCE